MKSIKDVLNDEPTQPDVKDYSNDWLSDEILVDTKDCQICNGTGWKFVASSKDCLECDGFGFINGNLSKPCETCGGVGKVFDGEVDEKRGKSRVREVGVFINDAEDFKKNNKDIVYTTIDEQPIRYFYMKEVVEQRCDCVLKKQALMMFKHRINKSGLGLQLKTKTFKTYEVREEWQRGVLDKCIGFVRNPEKLLALLGQTGAGKTHLGTAIVGNLVHKGYSASYVQWKEEMNLSKDNYYKVDSEKLNEWKKVDVLYIDDLFKNKKNDISLVSNHEFDFAWDLIDSRLKRGTITIISSEFGMNDFIKLDEGTAGRLNEMAGKYLIEIEKNINKNYRLKDLL